MQDIRSAVCRIAARAATLAKRFIVTEPPAPVTLPPDLRQFLIFLGRGLDAPTIEESHAEILRRAIDWGLVKYDYGSYQDNGWYVVTRLGRVSLEAKDKLEVFRSTQSAAK